MTDSPTPAEPGPVDPDVELASAHLDGEAGADERGRVDEPAVRAHRAALASVVDQVRDVSPPPTGLVDDHVAEAMAAFDDEGRVVSLGGRTSTQAWWQRIPLGAVAAGLVVVALIGAIGLASTVNDDDSADTATATFDAADEGTDAGDDSAPDDGESSGGAAMEESTALDAGAPFDATGERAAYDSYDALAGDLQEQLASAPDAGEAADAESDLATTSSQRTTDAGDEGATDPCGAVSLLGLDPADVVLVRPVVVTPDEVTAVVHETGDGRRLTVVEDASCAVVLDRLL